MIARTLEFYQRWISPALHAISGAGGACRFQPTCSEYAAAAVERHGVVRGLGLALWRLLRCNPLCHGGFDPAPGTYFPGASLGDGLHPAEASRAREAGQDPCRAKLRGMDGTALRSASQNGKKGREKRLTFPPQHG